jgi:hypothetical protein
MKENLLSAIRMLSSPYASSAKKVTFAFLSTELMHVFQSWQSPCSSRAYSEVMSAMSRLLTLLSNPSMHSKIVLATASLVALCGSS